MLEQILLIGVAESAHCGNHILGASGLPSRSELGPGGVDQSAPPPERALLPKVEKPLFRRACPTVDIGHPRH